jgi:membrane protein DedA with SNARE-associated domain|tara:strand:- start:228 stop:383 length:156 start_codon:yes stop_codon:yes gene_type:complete
MKTVPGRIVWIIGGFLVGGAIGAFIHPIFTFILCFVGAFLGDKLYYRAIKP